VICLFRNIFKTRLIMSSCVNYVLLCSSGYKIPSIQYKQLFIRCGVDGTIWFKRKITNDISYIYFLYFITLSTKKPSKKPRGTWRANKSFIVPFQQTSRGLLHSVVTTYEIWWYAMMVMMVCNVIICDII